MADGEWWRWCLARGLAGRRVREKLAARFCETTPQEDQTFGRINRGDRRDVPGDRSVLEIQVDR